MVRLWCFGDSFTGGNGCLPNEQYTLEYKKSENDLIWPELVSKNLNVTLFNYGHGGYSNDKIIDKIIEKYKLIRKDDVVIIGTTFYSRFDIPYDNELITLSPTNLPKKDNDLLLELIPIMDNSLLKDRQIYRINFFKNILENRGAKCIIWEVDTDWLKYENIKEASSNEIDDLHWSYKGHFDFSNYILDRIKSKIDKLI